MDADHLFSAGSAARAEAGRAGVPAPLDGEIIPPAGRTREKADKAIPPPANPATFWRPGFVLIAVTATALIGLGAAGGLYAWDRSNAPDATATALNRMQHDLGTLKSGVDSLKGNTEIARQDEAIKNLKKSVDTLKAELDSARGANAAALAQLNTKLDKPDRDPSPKLADIASRLDKLDRDPGPKLGDITARLDRIERQVSSPLPTGSIVPTTRALPQAPVRSLAQTPVPPIPAAPAVEKPAPKPTALGSWIVRDVYDGIALVEGRSGGIREVAPGEILPGAGEVRSIERRGRAWIVVTSRGIIDDSTW